MWIQRKQMVTVEKEIDSISKKAELLKKKYDEMIKGTA